MQPTSLINFYRTTRDFYKWVVDKDRKLSQVPPFTPPIDYSPNSGMQIGLLIEPYSRNYFIDSEGLSLGVIKSSNVSRTTNGLLGSTYALNFPSGARESSAGANINFDADAVAISFYVMQTNLQRPKIGYPGNTDTSIYFRVNGSTFNVPTSDIDVQGPMNDLSYRVRVRMRLFSGSLNNIEIVKPTESTKGFRVSKIQVEKNHWTSYIPTNGTSQDREAETVYRDLTHGIDVNENQGAFDVVYSPSPGSYGSAMTLLRNDWSEYLAFGHQKNEDGDAEALRFYSSSTEIEAPLRFFSEEITEKNAGIRASYSGYGARGVTRESTFVNKLKDYDSFKNGKFNRLHFGESYDGTHFCGHIHMVNGYARTLTDEEMLDFSFVVSDSGSDIDFELDTPSVVITAAAMFRTDKEAILYQNVVEPPTPQRILAAWPRSTSGTYFPDPSQGSGGNIDQWFFDDAQYSFVQPINSTTMEQIFSPVKLDNYEFETTLASDNGDDDCIGIALAADYIGGELLSVVACVQYGGGQLRDKSGNHWNFTLAFIDSTTEHTGSHRVNTTVLSANNVMGGNRIPNSRVGGGWKGKQVKIKAIRRGVFLSVKVSGWNGGEYLEDSEIIYNMQNLPRNGNKLLGPARYGFLSLSQAGSTYLDYNLRSDQIINDLKLYSQESNSFWYFTDNLWQLQSQSASNDLLPATRINNRRTNESFIIDPDTGYVDFSRSNGISENEGELNVSSNATTDILMSDLIDQFEYEEPLQFKNLYEESNVIAEQIILGGQQYLRIVSNATDGNFILLLGTEAKTNSFGVKDEIIAFRKVNVRVS